MSSTPTESERWSDVYVAEIHPVSKTVIRVVVAPSLDWCEQNIPGQVQTGTESVDDGEGGVIDVPVFTPTFWRN